MIALRPENPLIVQSDRTLLLEVAHPRFEEVRDDLARFAELVKSPEHIHTYRITPLSLWNASASGVSCEEMTATLERWSKYPVPQNLLQEIQDHGTRYGRLRLVQRGERLALEMDDRGLFYELENQRSLQGLLAEPYPDQRGIFLEEGKRGEAKLQLIRLGHPVQDMAGFKPGDPLPFRLRDTLAGTGRPFGLRPYQQAAVDVFHAGGGPEGGAGVLVLPCGAGKTVIAIGCMARLQTHTLVLTTNVTAVKQWKQELLDKTDLRDDQIGLYTGDTKEIRPVTIATYQILTYRKSKGSPFEHFKLFQAANWGLVIHDEVHMLPAPVFRAVAELQAKRRLGLTATLVREDGKEEDVFSLIGPKRVDVPWKTLEKDGFIATAHCLEIRVPLPSEERMAYAVADQRARFRIASENSLKLNVLDELLAGHPEDSILIIGQYLEQLRIIGERLEAPVLTGQTPEREREDLYRRFREGALRILIVSKVANFAIDLPDASVAVQVSGTFGSRQEEAQRLGRILRPKGVRNVSYFYSLISRDTSEQEFARNRQLFLTEQGYRYLIESRSLGEDGLSEPAVWKGLLAETGHP
ncbi:DNA repair helicase XPB [Mesoterricola sediminis]|uniref:DNA 3'-5' helicase n=1 Tax=Mesoterricola sediminis TaxID=2927980 RepID=A0AA48GVF2_9BACT|nr:DNA repair helicase XPB [Mesoterricola sediminis]BDU75120.1 DEAD/DEAH box helicase [Mesoterricola sediminis]